MDKTLVIMAAGLGTRFKGGIKQLSIVTDSGETIMDFSIYDAKKAGFNKVIFIIRKSIEEAFKNQIGNKIEKEIEVSYAYQEVDDLPIDLKNIKRNKPWGTVQALLSAKDLIKTPFLVINADDYYGKNIFGLMAEFLSKNKANSKTISLAMAGYKLKNTVSDNGIVTRGLCYPNEDMTLKKLVECRGILKKAGEIFVEKTGEKIGPENLVSMNMWAGYPDFIGLAEEYFEKFLLDPKTDLEKDEALLPIMIDELVRKKSLRVEIIPTRDNWIGITYQEDLSRAKRDFNQMILDNAYPRGLWSEG